MKVRISLVFPLKAENMFYKAITGMLFASYIRKIRRVEVKGVLVIRIAPLCNEVAPVL